MSSWKQTQSTRPGQFDILIEPAKRLVEQYPDKICITFLQRELHIGYNMARRLMDELRKGKATNER